MKFLFDEDLPPKAAEISRALGLDALSVHEISRSGKAISDAEQLRYATEAGRVFVTRNRDDFIRLTVEFHRRDEPTSGVLLVTGSLPNERPERIAHALADWMTQRAEFPRTFGSHSLDFLS